MSVASTAAAAPTSFTSNQSEAVDDQALIADSRVTKVTKEALETFIKENVGKNAQYQAYVKNSQFLFCAAEMDSIPPNIFRQALGFYGSNIAQLNDRGNSVLHVLCMKEITLLVYKKALLILDFATPKNIQLITSIVQLTSIPTTVASIIADYATPFFCPDIINLCSFPGRFTALSLACTSSTYGISMNKEDEEEVSSAPLETINQNEERRVELVTKLKEAGGDPTIKDKNDFSLRTYIAYDRDRVNPRIRTILEQN